VRGTGKRSRGTLEALGAVVIWGASFAATKRLLVDLSPGTLLFARTALGALAIGAMLGWRGRLVVLGSREWPALATLSICGIVATQLLQAWALEANTSAKTAWLVALNPVVTAALAVLLIGETLRGKVLGLVLGFAGAVLVTSEGRSLGQALALPATHGDLLTLTSTLTFALYTVGARTMAPRQDPAVVAFHLILFAGLAYLPGFLHAGGAGELGRLSARGWLPLAYLGVGCSGVAFLLYYASLEHLEASRAAAFIYVEPLIAQALGVSVMDEPLSGAVLAGGAAIVAGVYLVSRSADDEGGHLG
jgi:drug/metabolite transporter (DMT)-like permease